MARLARLSVGGLPHLLIHRGHNRQAVFLDDADRRTFYVHLVEAARTLQVAIHAYALRDHELRLLLTPPTDQALSTLMQGLGRRYGAYFNRRHGRTGALWDGRFRATVIEPEAYLVPCMRFVEASDEGFDATHWSSARHHLGQSVDALVSDHRRFWALGNTPFDREMAYRALLAQPLAPPDAERLEGAALRGWPIGDAKFVDALATQTGRRLTPQKRGRPRKAVVEGD